MTAWVPTPIPVASLIHVLLSLVVLLVLFLLMLLAGEFGFRAGRRQATSDGGRGHFGSVQASLLALLGLLLGFSLNMADQRFEARRASMMDDDITLASLNLRADFLPEPARGDFKRLLAEYSGVHLQAGWPQGTAAGEAFLARGERAEELHGRMLRIVRDGVQSVPPLKGAAEMVGPLSDKLAIHRRWVTAMETTVPPPILILLFATAVTAAGVVGYSGGFAQHRGNVQGALLAIFVSGIVFVIHELNTPLTGISQAGQRPLIHLKKLIETQEKVNP